MELAEAKVRHLDVPVEKAEMEFTLGQMYLDTADLRLKMGNKPEEARAWLDQADRIIQRGRMHLVPSRPVEARGLFLDAGSLPQDPDDLRKLLQRIKAAGFNMILPEVFRRGYTIYPSRYTLIDPEFAKNPRLFEVLVAEARRLELEIHPWIWTFRVRSPGFGDPILARFPTLAARTPQTDEPRFLSPASPEARALVYNIIGELVDRYHPDGVMLDYIRYDETIPEDEISLTRYRQQKTQEAEQRRNAQIDVLIRVLKPGAKLTPPVLKSPKAEGTGLDSPWQLWREEQVHTAVREIFDSLQSKPNAPTLAASVFRGERYARLNKMQNWRVWSNRGWIAWASPMLYTSKVEELRTWIRWETDNFKRKNLLFPILGFHRMDDPQKQTLAQIQEVRRLNQGGVLFFALAHLPPDVLQSLGDGPFRSPAVSPHHDPMRAGRRILAETRNHYLSKLYQEAALDRASSILVLWQNFKEIEAMIPLSFEVPPSGPIVSRINTTINLSQRMASEGVLPPRVSEEVCRRLEYARALIGAARP